MAIGILGGTGPAGRGLAVRLAAAGEEVVIGSRHADRAVSVADELVRRWAPRDLVLSGAENASAAEADVVVLATPWDATLHTVRPLVDVLSGRVVISMVVGLLRSGREFLGLLPVTGSMAGAVQRLLPESAIAAALHHLPASEMEELDTRLRADVLVCSDHPHATEVTTALVDRIEGLRAIDAGSLAQAGAIEAFTSVLTTVNVRHKVHSSLRLAGYGEGGP